MSGYPAFCATCCMVDHAGRACDANSLERRRRIVGLNLARQRLQAAARTAFDRNNYQRSGVLHLAAVRVALRTSALLAEEAEAIMGRRAT